MSAETDRMIREAMIEFAATVQRVFGEQIEHDLSPISEYEAERWRAIADELSGQAARLKGLCKFGTSAQWQAIEHVEAASRQLFSAFAAIGRENLRGE